MQQQRNQITFNAKQETKKKLNFNSNLGLRTLREDSVG